MNTLKNSKAELFAVLASLLLVFWVAFEFGKGAKVLWPNYMSPLILLFLSFGSAALISLFFKKSLKPFIAYALVVGSLGFALLFWGAHFTWQQALCVPLAAGTVVLLAGLAGRVGLSLVSLFELAFLAGTLVLALRLGGILGASFYGIVLISSFFIFSAQDNLKTFGAQLAFSVGLLVIGRAAIQYYLLQSGYASLGVVVSVPYSFLLLFLGFALPLVLQRLSAEGECSWLLWGVVSLLLPLSLGFIFHSRALAAYLLGLVSSGFIVFVLWRVPLRLGYFVYLNLILACAALPYFVQYSYLGRLPRVGILTLSALLLAFALLPQCLKKDSTAQL